MTNSFPTTHSTSSTSPTAARLAISAASAFVVLVALLHIIEPEFSPSWRFLSEYSNGHFGWVMKLAFLAQSLGCVALFLAIRSEVRTLGGKIGLGVLLAVAAALILAGLFNQDPITSKDVTTHGMLHGLAGLIGVPGFAVAALLVSASLARNTAWAAVRREQFWVAQTTWLSVVLMLVFVFITLSQGGFGPNSITGWANRLVMLTECTWLIVVALNALQINKTSAG